MGELHNYPVGIMASGSGTTFESFCHSIVANDFPMEVRAVVYDRPDAGVARRVEAINRTYGWDIRAALIDRDGFSGGPGEKKWHLTDEQSTAMAKVFDEEGVAVVGMQGFLSKIRGELFEERGALETHTRVEQASLINSHPGLLWLTKGLWGPDVHKKTRDSCVDHSAQTLHVASAEYDEGTTLNEHRVAVLPTYTWEDIEAAVQSAEKQFITPDTLAFIRAREAYLGEHPGN